jgi:hypothetical protein
MIKKDTIKPTIYSNPITPPFLQAITSTDIPACDYKKNHRDHDKYNVSHTIGPENRLVSQIPSQAQCQPLRRETIGFLRGLAYERVVICRMRPSNGCKMQARAPATRNKIFLSMILMALS